MRRAKDDRHIGSGRRLRGGSSGGARLVRDVKAQRLERGEGRDGDVGILDTTGARAGGVGPVGGVGADQHELEGLVRHVQRQQLALVFEQDCRHGRDLARQGLVRRLESQAICQRRPAHLTKTSRSVGLSEKAYTSHATGGLLVN